MFAALSAGASAFLLKDCEPEELVAAIRTVAAGEAMLAPAVTRQLINAFMVGSVLAATPRRDRLRLLSTREIEVLEQVASGLITRRLARRSTSARRPSSHT